MDTSEPIQVRSNAHFEEEFAKIRTTMNQKETEHNWQLMQDALKRLNSLCLGGATKVPGFVVSIKSIRDSFVSSVSTERTQLSGVAVELMETIMQVMGKEFAPLLDILIPSVVRLCGRTNKVFVKRAVHCLERGIQCTQLPEFLPLLVEGLQNQSKIMRRSVMECIATLIQQVPRAAMHLAQVTQLESALRTGLVDADVDTRGETRKAYDNYAKVFEDRVAEFMKTLEPRTQKTLGGGKAAVPNVSKPRAGAPGAVRQAMRQQMLQQRRKFAQQPQSVEDQLGAIEIHEGPSPDVTSVAIDVKQEKESETKAAPPTGCKQNGTNGHRPSQDDDDERPDQHGGDRTNGQHGHNHANGNGHVQASSNDTTNGTTNGHSTGANGTNTANTASAEPAESGIPSAGPTPPNSSDSTKPTDSADTGAVGSMDVETREPANSSAPTAAANTSEKPSETTKAIRPTKKVPTTGARIAVKRGANSLSVGNRPNRIVKRMSGVPRAIVKRTSAASIAARKPASTLVRPMRTNSTTAQSTAKSTTRVLRSSPTSRNTAQSGQDTAARKVTDKKPTTPSALKRPMSRPLRRPTIASTPSNDNNRTNTKTGITGSAIRLPIAARARGEGAVTKVSPSTATKRKAPAATIRNNLPKPQRVLRPNATAARHTERRIANTKAR